MHTYAAQMIIMRKQYLCNKSDSSSIRQVFHLHVPLTTLKRKGFNNTGYRAAVPISHIDHEHNAIR